MQLFIKKYFNSHKISKFLPILADYLPCYANYKNRIILHEGESLYFSPLFLLLANIYRTIIHFEQRNIISVEPLYRAFIFFLEFSRKTALLQNAFWVRCGQVCLSAVSYRQIKKIYN